MKDWMRGDIPDVEEREAAEDVEAPLVGTVDEGTDQATDDHEGTHEERGHDIGERETGGEENREEEEREGDEPLDVPHILYVMRLSKVIRSRKPM